MLRMIWKNLTRNRRRNLLTVLSIAFSMLVLTTLRTVLTEIDTLTQSDARNLRLIVRRATSWLDPLPASFRSRIATAPGVADVCGYTWYGGVYRDESELFPASAVDPAPFLQMYTEIHMAPEQTAAFLENLQGAIADRPMAERYEWKIGDRINLKGNTFPVDLELILVGIFDSDILDNSLYFRHDYFDKVMDDWGKVGMYWVLAQSSDDIPGIIEHVDSTFHNSTAPTKTDTEKAMNLEFISMLGNVQLAVTVVSSIILFSILMVVGNTMAMSVRERRREVGILKSLGFKSRQILGMLVGEALVLSLAGWMLGCAGGKLAYALVPRSLLHQNENMMIWGLSGFLVAAAGYLLLWREPPAEGRRSRRRSVAGALLAGTVGFIISGAFYLGAGNMINASPLLFGFKVTVGTLGLGFVVAVALALASSSIPAWRAAQMRIAEALRTLG